MHPHLSLVTGIDPKLTEEFLASQTDIEEASVWYTRGRLKAQVQVHDEANIDAEQLILACETVLGELQAPLEIEIVRFRRRTA
jgi:hypothetical protein